MPLPLFSLVKSILPVRIPQIKRNSTHKIINANIKAIAKNMKKAIKIIKAKRSNIILKPRH